MDPIPLLYFYVVLRIEPRTSHMFEEKKLFWLMVSEVQSTLVNFKALTQGEAEDHGRRMW